MIIIKRYVAFFDYCDVDEIEQAITFNPQDISNYTLHATVLRLLKRPVEAIASLEHSLQLQFDEKNNQLLFELYLQIGDFNHAKEVSPTLLSRVVQLESFVSRAHQLILTHQFSQCIPLFQAIRTQTPFWRSPFLDLLRCYVFCFQSQEAFQLLSSQCKWVTSLDGNSVLNTGLVEPTKVISGFDETLVYLTLLVFWQMNHQRQIMVLYRLAKKQVVHDNLNQLLDICEQYQRLDLEAMDLMTSNDITRAIQVFSTLHCLLENVQNKGVPIGQTIDNTILLNLGLLEMKLGRVENAICKYVVNE